MSLSKEIIGFLITCAALWHVAGFAFGIVYVRLSLLSLMGKIPYQHEWTPVLRSADLHLWLSGIALTGIGVWDKGWDVFISNPKFLSKVTIVALWLISTQLMRYTGVPNLKRGNKKPMLHLSAINISCWIYGAFLGCAKPLAYEVVSYMQFISGFSLLYIIIAILLLGKTRNIATNI